MRAVWICVALVVAAPSPTLADVQAPAVLEVHADDPQLLQQRLLAFTQERLQPMGVYVDSARARMSLSNSLLHAGIYEVRPMWPTSAQVPPLPLVFELRPQSGADPIVTTARDGSSRSIRATLAVPLLLEVPVAVRRLRKGSVVRCTDVEAQRRDIRRVPKLVLEFPCEIGPETVALRDIAAGDVMRRVDIGGVPDVTAGAPVEVSVAANGISVVMTAIALGDARVGDQIDVRVLRPTRTLRTRVTGPGSVELTEVSP